MVMDHGRSGPPGAQGGSAGGTNTVAIIRKGVTYVPRTDEYTLAFQFKQAKS